MANRKIEMYEYRQIIIQMRLGYKDREIARSGLAGRKKCKDIRTIAEFQGWLNPNGKVPTDLELQSTFDKNKCKSPQSTAAPYYETISSLVKAGHKSTTIYRHLVSQHRYKGSYTAIQVYIYKQFKDERATTTPLAFAAGDSAQVDFGQGPMLYNPDTGKKQKTWFFIMVLSYSRHMYAELVWHQDVETWIGCHTRAFNFFNGIPKKIIIDNAKCAVTKASRTDPVVQKNYYDYASELGFCISACAPRDPQKKGRVESGVKYIKNAFFPLREFKNIDDANVQLKHWILTDAGNRKHGTTGKSPLNEFSDFEEGMLLPLPEVMPELATWKLVKAYKDCHIRYDKNLYSVPYQYVGQQLWVRVTETTIKVYKDHELIAIHCRSRKERDVVTITNHIPPNAKAYFKNTPEACRETATKVGPKCSHVIEVLLSDKVTDRLKAAQNIIRLLDKYSKVRIEAACSRAIQFNSVTYEAIKKILKDGLEYHSLEDEYAFDSLSKAYTSGIYYRNFSKDIH